MHSQCLTFIVKEVVANKDKVLVHDELSLIPHLYVLDKIK